jgi:hypothetical protein
MSVWEFVVLCTGSGRKESRASFGGYQRGWGGTSWGLLMGGNYYVTTEGSTSH